MSFYQDHIVPHLVNLAMRNRAKVSDAGSRCDFWRSRGCPHQEHGDRRSGHSSAIALAESICGTPDRIDSARVPGSRHRVERDVDAADSAKLFSVLREVAHAFSPGERCPRAESCRWTGERSYRWHSPGGRLAPSIRTAGCLAVSLHL